MDKLRVLFDKNFLFIDQRIVLPNQGKCTKVTGTCSDCTKYHDGRPELSHDGGKCVWWNNACKTKKWALDGGKNNFEESCAGD